MRPLLALGSFVFGPSTLAFDELQRRRDWRHVRSPRIGAPDATQFTGPGEDTLSLKGTAYAELGDGRASIDQLVAMAGTGEPFELVDGLGHVHGSFVISSLDDGAKAFFPDGTARAIDFRLELLAVDAARRA